MPLEYWRSSALQSVTIPLVGTNSLRRPFLSRSLFYLSFQIQSSPSQPQQRIYQQFLDQSPSPRDATCQRVPGLNPCWESMVESRKVWLVLFKDNNINVSRNNSQNNISFSWLLSLSIKNLCVAKKKGKGSTPLHEWVIASNTTDFDLEDDDSIGAHSAQPGLSSAWHGPAQLGSAWPPTRHGSARLSLDGPAQLGLAWIWLARLGSDQ